MGLNEIVDIQEISRPDPTGGLTRIYRVTFTTEEASGTFEVDIDEADFSPELARERASERADEIDAAFAPTESE
jgi:hypothetical protein